MVNEPRHAAMLIEYDGAELHGWSRQPGLRSVQGELEHALAALRIDALGLRCAGRTDAGVHATGQVASLAYTGSVPPDRLARALNGKLPADVCVVDSVPCAPEFDARACARTRAYVYRLLTRPAHSPLRRGIALHHPRPLDMALLDACAAAAAGQHDFSAFTPARTSHEFFHRTLLESRWERAGDELRYHVVGNAFLRHMVRVLVGTMICVARGDMALAEFHALLDGAPRSAAGHTAPPHGLCLTSVTYDAEWGLPSGWVR